jgi:hypothetical protein
MKRFLAIGLIAIGLAACQTVSGAINAISAVHGAILQKCSADVEQTVLEQLISRFTNLDEMVREVCDVISPKQLANGKVLAPPRMPVVRGVVIRYKRVAR